MQLPQKTMDMTGAESQPEHKAGAQCGTSKPDVLLPPGMEPSVFPQPGGMPGMPFGSHFSRPNIDAPLPSMPGSDNMLEPAADFGAAAPLGSGPDAGAGRLPDLDALMADLGQNAGDMQPMGLDAAAAKKKEPSNLELFLRQLLMGGEHEQRPDKSLKQSLHETVDRILGKGGQQGAGGMANALQQGNPGLFAAMDAPLRGLTPDDILFANEVDAALARRPKFGVRALSISVAAFFLCLIIWAAVASVDEVTHAEGSVVG